MDSQQLDDLEALTGFGVTMMLADYAAVAEGKLTLVGGGWTNTSPGPAAFAIGMLLEIPRTLTDRKHEFLFELLDADGAPVTAEGADEPMSFSGEFQVSIPDDLDENTIISMPVAVNHAGFLFPPDSQLEWRLSINGKTRQDWRLNFTTSPEQE